MHIFLKGQHDSSLLSFLPVRSRGGSPGCSSSTSCSNKVSKDKGLPVTEVGRFAFSDLNAQKIVLPESVLRIGDWAFSYCDAIEIVLPQKMQSIGDAAFYCCYNLKKINLPDGIERAPVHGDDAFLRALAEEAGMIVSDSTLFAALRVDGNQGYTPAIAARMLKVFAAHGVDEAEQLLSARDLEGSAWLRDRAEGVAIMLDEAVHAPADALRACALGAADKINIKLMKCGGLFPALSIDAIAAAAGLECMVGCMLETPVAISAGLSLAAARANIPDTDCDSFRYYDASLVPVQGAFVEQGDVVVLSEEPGLGVSVAW